MNPERVHNIISDVEIESSGKTFMSDSDFKIFLEKFTQKMKSRSFDNALEILKQTMVENQQNGLEFSQEQKNDISNLAIQAGVKGPFVL